VPLINPPTKPPVLTVSSRPRFGRPAFTATRPTTSVAQSRQSTRPVSNVGSRNRRYAAVLSHLNKHTTSSPSSEPSSSAFSGYVPKHKQSNSIQCVTTTKSVADGSTEQRRTKVSFCLQSTEGGTLDGYKTNALSSRRVSASSSAAASVTSNTVSCGGELASTTASLLPLSSTELNVTDFSHVQMPAESSDMSLLCAELFVANNASFCDQLLESCPLPHEQSEAPIFEPENSSFNSKEDIPEPVTDFAFDDFVEFDFFSCN